MLLMTDVIRRGVMKRHWQRRRQLQPTADGARRWDQASQSLLGWPRPYEVHVGSTLAPLHRLQTEDNYENGHLCPRVDRAADAGTNACTAGGAPHRARACPGRAPTGGGHFP